MSARRMKEDMEKTEKKRDKDQGPAEGEEAKEPNLEDLALRAEELEEELAEKSDRLLRMAAEMENFKKRLEREKEDFLRFANTSFAKDLLQVVDSLDRALEHSQADDADTVLDGVELTRRLLLEILEKYGVEGFSAQDQPFDPEMHEALNQMEVEDREKHGLCVQEYQKGYTIKGRLLRPSRVAVGSFKDEEKEPEKTVEKNAGTKIKVRVNK